MGNWATTHLQSKQAQYSKDFNEIIWPKNEGSRSQREEKVTQSLQRSREDDLWEPKGGIYWSPKVAPLHGNLLLYVNTYID